MKNPMAEKILFIYNHRSGRGHAAENAQAVASELAQAGTVVALPVDFKADPFDGHDDAATVVVSGGDGTVNYVVNRMKARGLNPRLGVIPSGTANDFAHALGMSNDPVKAARQIVSGEVRQVDCGSVNGLRFVNVFSFGLFTTTSQHTSDRRKHRLGKMAYIIEGIKEMRRMHGVPLHLSTGSGEFDTEILMALIFNGETAGGFRLARNSSIHDGRFECLLLRKRNFFSSCWAMLLHLLGCKSRGVIHISSDRIEINSPLNEPTDVDGQKGPEFPLLIECLHYDLQVIVPTKK